MTYNANYHTTFVAMINLCGLRSDLAELISNDILYIDNSALDTLIALMTDELQKSRTFTQVERNI